MRVNVYPGAAATDGVHPGVGLPWRTAVWAGIGGFVLIEVDMGAKALVLKKHGCPVPYVA